MDKRYCTVLIVLFLLALVPFTYSQVPTSSDSVSLILPASIEAIDTPNDKGESYLLIWPKSPSEGKNVTYVILTSGSPEGVFAKKDSFESTDKLQSDKIGYFGVNIWKNQNYHYYEIPIDINTVTKQLIPVYAKVAIARDSTEMEISKVFYTEPKSNWFKFNKLNNLIWVCTLFFFIYLFVTRAIKNPNVFIRRIAGLEAVEEAIGRATEMGKPILYLTGAYDISAVSTIASVNILSHVSKKVAAYDSRIIVPCRFSIAMSVCQEVVRESYMNAGRPDAFNINDIYYVSEDQFAFTAAVDGIMVREKPAANFFLGTFAAESIILSETGASTGAIQIAGTDSTYQIPFFIVACDYTLIGEELYAASAYLSREPKLLGSLKGQDVGKMILITSILLGSLLATVYYFIPVNMQPNFIWITFIKKVFLAIL